MYLDYCLSVGGKLHKVSNKLFLTPSSSVGVPRFGWPGVCVFLEYQSVLCSRAFVG